MLQDYGIRGSMSKPGYPYDNSYVESFFASMKKEYIRRREYGEVSSLRADLFYYIEPEASAQHPGLYESGCLQTAALSGRNGLKTTTDWYAYARNTHSAFPYQSRNVWAEIGDEESRKADYGEICSDKSEAVDGFCSLIPDIGSRFVPDEYMMEIYKAQISSGLADKRSIDRQEDTVLEGQ